MRMTQSVRAVAAVCLCLLLIAVYMGAVLPHTHEGCVEHCTLSHVHQHGGTDCSVCVVAAVYRRVLGGLLLCALLYQSMATGRAVAQHADMRMQFHHVTPVYLKVKLSN